MQSWSIENFIGRVLRFFSGWGIFSRDRVEPRFRASYRVSHSDLPAFAGTTVDLSQRGMCIETGSSLPLSGELPLVLEVGRSPIELKARVAWCRRVSPFSYRIGFRLESSRAESLKSLDMFLARELTARSLS